MKILITGLPGCGKTTLIKKIIGGASKPVGGIISGEIREAGIRKGFKLTDIASKKEGILAHVNQKMGPRIGKYTVNLEDLENLGAKAIENATENSDLIVIDEIGPMELFSERFINSVKRVFDSEKDVVATIHFKSKHPVVEEIKGRKDVALYILNETNRNKVFDEIMERIK